MHRVYYLFFLGYWFISLWVSCVWAAIHSRIRTNKPSKEETQIQLAGWSSTLQVGHQHAHSLYWFPLSKCQAFSGCTYFIMHPWFCYAVSWKNFHLVLVTTVKFANIKLFELPWIKNSYSLKWRWLVVEIWQPVRQKGKCPPLATDSQTAHQTAALIFAPLLFLWWLW